MEEGNLIMLEPQTEAAIEPGEVDREERLPTRLRGEYGTQSSHCLSSPGLKLGVVFRGSGQSEGGVGCSVEVHETAEYCRFGTLRLPPLTSSGRCMRGHTPSQ